ncbi:DJ-1/PfpI/YhbO family deglycase/protease [Nocardioides yefusunii]|uniref:DJ-1/PfpI/YhbO family deglycase/protease n=1 Tax=Nocardioides yefusunii TaxID=2500546 RepID=A0ABW1QVM3_9ACTN|nr:DJ-1/PfpI/YhbO family deglycase/protease [Nocardioides yefusunii]
MSDSRGRVAFLTASEGIERIELTAPWKTVRDAGFTPVLVSPEAGEVELFDHLTAVGKQPVDAVVADVGVDEFVGLVLPGGVANPDALRMDADAVAFVGAFVDSGRPVAAICHAAWTLVEADRVRGRRLASWPSLATDIRNAGGEWVDEEVVVDVNLVTSRNPSDLPAFNRELIKALKGDNA